MKLTDLLSKVLKKNLVKNVYGLQGGAVVHIFDSLKKEGIKITFTHHEESAALAAVANAKATNELGCAVVTTGPGATNAITGLMAAWQDSIPVIFISGQARSNHTSYNKKVRQVGTQEVNICDVVKPLTKYTKFIKKRESFFKELNKAIQIAKSGRPGPVWLDLALEMQWAEVKDFNKITKINAKKLSEKIVNINKAIRIINERKKVLFILGYGVKLSKLNQNKMKKFFHEKNIPFVLTWNTADLFPTNDAYNLGIIGMSGQRGANKSMFDCDLIVCLGTHLSIPHTTTLYRNFSPNSKKIIVNIDKDQLKNLNVKFDIKIHSDCKIFFEKIISKIKKKENKALFNYKNLNWYEPTKKKLPNSNTFIHHLTSNIKSKNCIIIDGGGTALYAGFQSSVVNKNTKIICSSAISSMGTGLPETLGAFDSKKFKDLFCIIGDGSFLMNCQELQTIRHKNINVKIILVNNNGYAAIRHTQKEFLNKKYIGTLPPNDISFPNFMKLSKAFNIKYIKIDTNDKANKLIKNIQKLKGPIIIDLIVDQNQEALFKQGYKKNIDGTFFPMPLSEMFPFVDKPISNTNN